MVRMIMKKSESLFIKLIGRLSFIQKLFRSTLSRSSSTLLHLQNPHPPLRLSLRLALIRRRAQTKSVAALADSAARVFAPFPRSPRSPSLFSLMCCPFQMSKCDCPLIDQDSPRILRASWMSLGKIVTRLSWIAQRFVSSKRCTS